MLGRMASVVNQGSGQTLPMQPGHAEQRTHDYVRYGTTTLFAALEIATGKVTGLCKNRHRHQEFLAFLKHLARTYPDGELHLVMDNLAAHKRVEISSWLAANEASRLLCRFHTGCTSGLRAA
jgi:transposase